MRNIIKISFFTIVAVLLLSCNGKNNLKVDISNIKKVPDYVRFEQKLFDIPLKDTLQGFTNLRDQYPDFFDLFTYKVIQIGGINNNHFNFYISKFITDSLITDVKAQTDKVFSDFKTIKKELNKAFKYYQYHFPDKPLPTIYTYISGFNQSIIVAENILGIGLDKYLGTDNDYYQQLANIQRYKIKNMKPEKVATDAMYGWLITEFEPPQNTNRLIDFMIYNGKMLYLLDALFPDTSDDLKIGYTKEQLQWVKDNELPMWTSIIENKMLYSNKRMDIIRYINDGPTTNGFPQKSPAKTGVWLGWQIVRKYMKEHPQVTLKKLINNHDYQQILSQSKYAPN